MTHWWGSAMTGWAWIAVTTAVIFFWGLVGSGIAALVRYVRGHDRASSRPTPEQLLAERYARGEIDETEYRRGLDNLKAAGTGHGSASRH